MKKLLHLYNYGHNPFPHIGKGGLGYHLPQYRKRGEGLHLNKDTGEYEDDKNYSDDQVYDQGFIIGKYNILDDYAQHFKINLDEGEYDDDDDGEFQIGNPNKIDNPLKYIDDEYSKKIEDYEKYEVESFAYDPFDALNKLDITYKNFTDLKGYIRQFYKIPQEINKLKKEDFMLWLQDELMSGNTEIKKFMDFEVERGLLDVKPISSNTIGIQSFEGVPENLDTEKLNVLFQESFNTSFDQLYYANGNNLNEENIYNMKDENEASKFKEMFVIDDPLIYKKDDIEYYVKVKSVDADGKEGKSFISQNTYDSGKDFEAKLLRNSNLLLTVIKQVFGDETTMVPIVEDPNASPEQKYAGFDSYTRVITVGNVVKTLFIELKKYDNYFHIDEEMNESKKDFRNFLANKVKDTELEATQTRLKFYKSQKDQGVYTDEQYEELIKPDEIKLQQIRDDLITNFKYNYNKEFSFSNGNSMNMKYLKLPLYTGESEIPGKFKNMYENIENIKKYQQNPHKTRKTTKEELTSALTGSNDILYIVLTNGGLLAQSYKQYIDKFYNDEIKEYSNKHHIIRTSRLKHSAYNASKNAPVDSYGLNVHNMICINTKNTPTVPKEILDGWKTFQTFDKVRKIFDRAREGTLKYQLIPVKKSS